MKPQAPAEYGLVDDPLIDVEDVDQVSEDDLWFLPGPVEREPDHLPPGPWAEPLETAVLDEWRKAEAGHAARLARVAGRLGALDDRLRHGPEGWRHRLALIEGADLSWFVGDRLGADRLALWISMRLSGVQDESRALARVGWAVRRLSGGLGPEVDLSAFLDRRNPEKGVIRQEIAKHPRGEHAGELDHAQCIGDHKNQNGCRQRRLFSDG